MLLDWVFEATLHCRSSRGQLSRGLSSSLVGDRSTSESNLAGQSEYRDSQSRDPLQLCQIFGILWADRGDEFLLMFVAPARQWICSACRKRIFDRLQAKRAFAATTTRWQTVEGMHPGVLALARKMASQHKELEQKAAALTEYTPQSVQLYKRISELEDVAKNLTNFEQTQKVTDLGNSIAKN
jgi:hypothetical protein